MNHIKSQLIIILTNIMVDILTKLQDIYLFCRKYINSTYIYLWLNKLINIESTDIIGARTTDTRLNIYFIVVSYYKYHQIYTVANLYRWLRLFNIEDQYVDIIFLRNNYICISRIDLNCDTEQFTGKYIETTTLDLIPCKIIS